MLKNILGRVFALWAIVVFVITLAVVVLIILIVGDKPEPKRSKILQPVYQAWMTVFFVLTGVRRVFKGREQFNKNEAFVIVCNHRSLMDPPLSSPGIPEPNKTIAKMEMSKLPLFGVLYKSGSVLVDRKSEESRKQSYLKMRRVLELGMHMCIYPEGTRNRSSAPLRTFHDGAFRLAADAGKRIMPAVIFNTTKVLPPNKPFYYWPAKVEMHFLPPVNVEGKTAEALKEEVYRIMEQYYVQNQP
ncbi:MAG TPA: lysophospholipid acyltransferase family protein [Flavisolibacter sp.]|nr:lysophospholipid acyltransferase family protein [Flavisolibacter sp.]